MSERVVDADFSGQDLPEATISDRVFVGDTFDRAFFEHRTYLRCVFVGCSFRLASFDRSNFVRCVFRGNDFAGAFGDEAQFIECHGALDNFRDFRFMRCRFGFLSTDGSSFCNADMPRTAWYPPQCREVIAEIIRKSGDHPGILAVAGLIHNWHEFCWETLARIALQSVALREREQIVRFLGRYPSLRRYLALFAEEMLHSKEGVT